MSVFLSIIGVSLFTWLVLLTSMRVAHSQVSVFELRRRKKLGDKKAEASLRREELLMQLGFLVPPLSALTLIALVVVLVYLLGRSGGLGAALVAGLLYGRLASLPLVRRLAGTIARRSEPRALRLAEKYETIFRLLGGRVILQDKTPPLGSVEELMRTLESSPLFSEDDKRLLTGALRFKNRTVKEIMTPRSKVVTVPYTELLGPLVLDDLHKTGHVLFPVAHDNEIVGLLDSSDHVALRTKESVHVRDVMYRDLARIDQDARLDEALEMLTPLRRPLLLVDDADGQTVGIINLGDVVQALIGKKQR